MRSNGSRSWTPLWSPRFVSAIPISVSPRLEIDRHRQFVSSPLARPRGSSGCRRSARACVGARRARVVGEPEPQHDRPAHAAGGAQRRVTRSTRIISTASSSCRGRGRRPSARCAPIDRLRARVRTGRGSRLCASACRCRPRRARASRRTSASSSSATCRTVPIPRARSFAAVTRPTPHSRSTGSGCRNASSSLRRDHQQSVGLGDGARHLGEELRARDADADREPDFGADLAPEPRGDLGRGAGDPLEPADVEERLVDRERLDIGRKSLEHREHRLARLAVGGHPRRDDGGVRAQPPCLGAAHRGLDPVRTSLRSSPRARLPPRRSPAGRVAEGRRAARPTRRTSRGRRGGSWPLARTYVRASGGWMPRSIRAGERARGSSPPPVRARKRSGGRTLGPGRRFRCYPAAATTTGSGSPSPRPRSSRCLRWPRCSTATGRRTCRRRCR